MKTQSARHRGGFTLVELLVVMAIVAVLAAGGFAAGTNAINKAKQASARVTCVALESAVNNFFTEYGSMPKENLSADTEKTDSTDLEFLKVLLGTEPSAGSTLNTRGMKLLQVKEGKSKRDGIIFDSSGKKVLGLYDPWGGPYFIALDGDYDERVTADPVGTPKKVLNKRVAVWSNGADAAPSGKGGKGTDNVTTW